MIAKNSVQIQEMKNLLNTKEMNQVKPYIFWFDLIILSILGWTLIFIASFSFHMIIFILGTFLLYKGTMLIHEVSHLSKKIPGYKRAYNILLGYPNSYPAYIYDTHLFHHGNC